VIVDKGLDWIAGEWVAFADNSFDATLGEDRIIESYNKFTGELIVT
jgi:hypothetical protein